MYTVSTFKEYNQSCLKRELIGNKGYNLLKIISTKLQVPEAIIINTELCKKYFEDKSVVYKCLEEEILPEIQSIEKHTKYNFFTSENPMLLSSRSGGVISMPGMMDTILNVGMNFDKYEVISAKNTEFALDIYSRFIKYFSKNILKISDYKIVRMLDGCSIDDIQNTIKYIKDTYNMEIPQCPKEQVRLSICAVMDSCYSDRAMHYRKIHRISDIPSTAVILQRMVFGNLDESSYTGVAFTRDPVSGDNKITCEYIKQAQGEDIVAGTSTPTAMTESFQYYHQICHACSTLEKLFAKPQDIEFTIESGNLYILQTRNAKLSPIASINVAYDMVHQKIIDKRDAIKIIDPYDIASVLYSNTSITDEQTLITTGIPASRGCISGVLILSSEMLEKYKAENPDSNAILCTIETLPDDIKGMRMSSGILTSKGGLTSHAAVIARGMGKIAVVGSNIDIDYRTRKISFQDKTVNEFDYITIDGGTGNIYTGKGIKKDRECPSRIYDVINWANDISDVEIHGNADTANECRIALKFGVKGIGLCRTEHMFMSSERIKDVRKMLLGTSKNCNISILHSSIQNVYMYQVRDFVDIYNVMGDMPVKIRLLDMPLHEFLPSSQDDILEIANELELSDDSVNSIFNAMHEKNPMLGFRGCRMGIINPIIYKTQCDAIFQAAYQVSLKKCINIKPKIMIPLIFCVEEIVHIKRQINDYLDAFNQKNNSKLECSIGIMIETPGAAICIDKLKYEVDFFSIGTNDLTQMTLGISRDDASAFLQKYEKADIIDFDPFESIDDSVVDIIKISIDKIGTCDNISVCGEHGGDPRSIKKLHALGLKTFSCSPFRVLSARISSII